jgi:hypothetical protein
MRRMLSAAVLGLLGVLVTAGVASAGEVEFRKRGDLARGKGTIESGPIVVTLRVHARSRPFGDDPRGKLWFRGNPPPFGAVDIRGRVTCLTVTDNVAVIGFEVTKSKAGFPVGSGGVFTVVDGEGGEPDRFEGAPTGAPPTVCPPPLDGNPITSGDFVVIDGPPDNNEV